MRVVLLDKVQWFRDESPFFVYENKKGNHLKCLQNLGTMFIPN
jgi:hypothetical protein